MYLLAIRQVATGTGGGLAQHCQQSRTLGVWLRMHLGKAVDCQELESLAIKQTIASKDSEGIAPRLYEHSCRELADATLMLYEQKGF